MPEANVKQLRPKFRKAAFEKAADLQKTNATVASYFSFVAGAIWRKGDFSTTHADDLIMGLTKGVMDDGEALTIREAGVQMRNLLETFDA